jgi:hypothetical protein
LCARVIKSIETHILDQDVQAMDEGAGGCIAVGTLSCGRGRNRTLLNVPLKGSAGGKCAHIT